MKRQIFICPIIKNSNKGKRTCFPLGHGVDRWEITWEGFEEGIGYGFDLDGLQQVEWAEERHGRKKGWHKAKRGAGACKVRGEV